MKATCFTETSKIWAMLKWYGYDIDFMSCRYRCPGRYCCDIDRASLQYRHDFIATISCRCLCKGMSFHHHFDVASMTMIFQKKFNFLTILIMHRHDIATTYRNDIVSISLQRNVLSSPFRFCFYDDDFSKKNSTIWQYRSCINTTSPQLIASKGISFHWPYKKEMSRIVIKMVHMSRKHQYFVLKNDQVCCSEGGCNALLYGFFFYDDFSYFYLFIFSLKWNYFPWLIIF